MNIAEKIAPEDPSPYLRLGEDIVAERDVRVRMSDGVHISVDIFRPAAAGDYPVLFAIAPYIKLWDDRPVFPTYRFRETHDIAWFVRRGYVYVHADTRGSGKSLEGDYEGWGAREQKDMYEIIEWSAVQDWSNGNVGMIGYSYYGVCQWLAAATMPPSLKCIAPYDASADPYRDFFFHGGVYSMGFAQWWVPKFRKRVILDMPGEKPEDVMKFDLLEGCFRHPTYDEFWETRDASARFSDIKIPVYSIANWNMVGLHLRGNILGYECVAGPKKLLVYGGGGGLHAPHKLALSREVHEELLRWYDHWLKGVDTGIMDEPPVKYVTRPNNKWYVASSWPIPEIDWRNLYLAPGKASAIDSVNDGRLDWDAPPVDGGYTQYSYAHAEWGGWPGSGTTVIREDGSADPFATIATFTTAPLKEDIEICGPIVMKLWASSDQPDTDFYVKLADQPPATAPDTGSGRTGITRGWLRAARRRIDQSRSQPWRPFHDHREDLPLVPGQAYLFEIEVWPTSWLFKKGHRIRIEIAPGDSPLTDEPFWHDFGARLGSDRILHDDEHPSHMMLPVVTRARKEA